MRGEWHGAECGCRVRHEAICADLAQDERQHRRGEEQKRACRDARRRQLLPTQLLGIGVAIQYAGGGRGALTLKFASLDQLKELMPKAMGILEPEPELESGAPRPSVEDADGPLELLLMPGLCFGRNGGRLGRGGGYYDAFLARARQRHRDMGWATPKCVAVAYRAQVVDEVPLDPHDEPLDALLHGVRRPVALAEDAIRDARGERGERDLRGTRTGRSGRDRDTRARCVRETPSRL